MCMEQGQHNPRKNYPWHPLCHGFIRYADDYFSVESCRSSSSSLPTNRIPGLAVGLILMISPSTSTFPPSVIVYALQMSFADTRKSPCLSFPFSSSRSSSWCHFLTRGTGTQYTVGAVVSLTVTLELQEFEFPEPSVALQETLVVPSGQVDPDAGQRVEAILQLSLAPALMVAVAPPGPAHSTI